MTTVLDSIEDPFEREILTSRAVGRYYEDADACEYTVETRVLLGNLEVIQKKITPAQQRAARLYMEGRSRVSIAETLGCHPSTVGTWLHNANVARFIGLVGRMQHLSSGPTRAERLSLLWRIARREEENNPRVAIAAVDTINKQTGDYQPLTDVSGGINVTVNQFNVQTGTDPAPSLTSPTGPSDASDAVDADFTPVTVDLDGE